MADMQSMSARRIPQVIFSCTMHCSPALAAKSATWAAVQRVIVGREWSALGLVLPATPGSRKIPYQTVPHPLRQHCRGSQFARYSLCDIAGRFPHSGLPLDPLWVERAGRVLYHRGPGIPAYLAIVGRRQVVRGEG